MKTHILCFTCMREKGSKMWTLPLLYGYGSANWFSSAIITLLLWFCLPLSKVQKAHNETACSSHMYTHTLVVLPVTVSVLLSCSGW